MSYFYPPHHYDPSCYRGVYQGTPYQTQFSQVGVTPGALRQGRRHPSTNLSQGADQLTGRMQNGLGKCAELMCSSKNASGNALELGKRFDVFSDDFCHFADSATKFLGTMTYPDFKLVTHPKTTFNEVGVWKSMNEDFLNQLDEFTTLKYYDEPDKSSGDSNGNKQNNRRTMNPIMRRNLGSDCPPPPPRFGHGEKQNGHCRQPRQQTQNHCRLPPINSPGFRHHQWGNC